jgi:hypothetical protein
MWDAKLKAEAEAEAELARIEAEENKVSSMQYHPATDAALREIAWGIATDTIFTNRHCLNASEIEIAFPVLQMMELCDRKFLAANPPGLIWEWYSKASPRGVNGLPMFFSAHFLAPADLPRMEAYLKEAFADRAKWVDVDQLGPVDIDEPTPGVGPCGEANFGLEGSSE